MSPVTTTRGGAATSPEARPGSGSGIAHAPATQVWTAMTIVYVVWGSTYLGIAVVVRTLPPLLAMSLRFVVAAAVLGLVLTLRRGPRALAVDRAELRGAAIVGALLLGVGMGMVTLAEQYVPSGVAALVVSIMPVWVVLLRTFTGDRPSAFTWAGVVLGFVGLVLLVRPGSHIVPAAGATDAQRVLWSMLMPLGTMCWALGSFLQPRIRTPRDPLVLSTYEMLTGALALGLVGLLRGERPSQLADGSAQSWAGWIYLVVVGSLFAYSAYVWVVGHAPLSLVATYAYVNPVVAVLVGFLVLGEPLTSGLLLGGSVIVAGVVLVVSGERRTRSPG
jgi:drug/metabolite transporter (DMT)-like permease